MIVSQQDPLSITNALDDIQIHHPSKLTTMAITILPPKPPANATHDEEDDFDTNGVDLEGDIDMLNTTRPAKKASGLGMVTPGETVTDDPQWMRSVSPYPARTLQLS